MEVNRERVRLLVDDLRTTREKKGTGFLHAVSNTGESTWCCLGRASHLAAVAGLEISRVMIDDGNGFSHEQFGELADEVLCGRVMEWYGFGYPVPELVTPAGKKIRASVWNDHGPRGSERDSHPEDDFTAIADGFERTYLQEREDDETR